MEKKQYKKKDENKKIKKSTILKLQKMVGFGVKP